MPAEADNASDSLNQMSPDFGVKSIMEETDQIKVDLVVKNVNYDQLMGDLKLKAKFVKEIQEKISHQAGNGVYAQHVKVTLAPGSVAVTAHINPPAYVSRSYLQKALEKGADALAQDVTQAIASIPGIESISTGTISVSAPKVAIQRSTATQGAAAPKDDDDKTVFMIVASSSVVFAFFMAVVSCFMWRKLRAVKNANIDVNGTTVAIGRPVGPPSADNPVVEGIAVTLETSDANQKPSPASPEAKQAW